ncbi:hypothetical protein ACTXT7_004966, partial [Hymenolepis weldensis]
MKNHIPKSKSLFLPAVVEVKRRSNKFTFTAAAAAALLRNFHLSPYLMLAYPLLQLSLTIPFFFNKFSFPDKSL